MSEHLSMNDETNWICWVIELVGKAREVGQRVDEMHLKLNKSHHISFPHTYPFSLLDDPTCLHLSSPRHHSSPILLASRKMRDMKEVDRFGGVEGK